MPINPTDIKIVEVNDLLDAGRVKINDNFEFVRNFVNGLESLGVGSGSTDTVVQNAHGFTPGTVVRHNGISYVKSTAQTTESSVILGIVTEVPTPNSFVMAYTGSVITLSGLTPGASYYLQDDGSLGTTPGTVTRVVFVATSTADAILVNELQGQRLGANSDVDTAGVADGYSLTFRTSDQKWAATPNTLAQLSDTYGTPTNGQVLMFNNSLGKWQPGNAPGGGDMFKATYDSDGDGIIDRAALADSVTWGNVTNKPATFPSDANHVHPISAITGLAGELSNKAGLNGANFTAPISIVNNAPYYVKETGGTSRAAVNMNPSNTIDIGDSAVPLALKSSSAIVSPVALRAPTPASGDDTDLVNRKFYTDNLPVGGGGGASIYEINLGNTSGTKVVDLTSNKSVNAYGTLTGNTTLSMTNVPSTGFVIVTMSLTQNSTGGYSLTYPGNTTHLNGGTGAVNTTANSTSIVTLVTTNGGSTWVAAVADARPNQYEAFYLNPSGNGNYYIVFPYSVTLDLSSAWYRVASGTPTLTYARMNNLDGAFGANVTGSQTFNANDVLRVTVAGFSEWLALTIPRTA
ncbi:MAG: hypothetical protein WC965_02065 [Thiohalomonadaceae bacterium]